MYQRAATVAAVGGRMDEAIALYQRAVSTDENHAGALFGLALENDRLGNDEECLRLYEQAAKAFPTGIGVLIKLGSDLKKTTINLTKPKCATSGFWDYIPITRERVCI